MYSKLHSKLCDYLYKLPLHIDNKADISSKSNSTDEGLAFTMADFSDLTLIYLFDVPNFQVRKR